MTEGINRVILKGTIIHLFEIPGKDILIVSIGTGQGNKANVTITQNFAQYFRQHYKLFDKIVIEGAVQDSWRPDKGVRNNILVTGFLDEKDYPQPYINSFDIYGTVKNVVKLGKRHKININVVSNGYASTVPVTFYYNDFRLNAEPGEPIRVCGTVITEKGHNRHYQNYVANGII